ncbi:MAG: hypothetical protein HOQ24_11345 [Mycobacteriaceae bacterium]|nr:hypothetical protein [Mycobacteriaceae bacterium]
MSQGRRGSRGRAFRNYYPLPGLPINSRRPPLYAAADRRDGFGLIDPAWVVGVIFGLLGLGLVLAILLRGSSHHAPTVTSVSPRPAATVSLTSPPPPPGSCSQLKLGC